MYKLTEEEAMDVSVNIARWIAMYCYNNGIRYPVVGVSGGLDSAVVLGLCKEAEKIAEEKFDHKLNTVGITLPCETDPNATKLAKEVMEKFGVEPYEIDLFDLFDLYIKDVSGHLEILTWTILSKNNPEVTHFEDCFDPKSWEWSRKITEANVKPRLRMIVLYSLARLLATNITGVGLGKGIVVSTDNLSEYWMGFWTLHGDVGDIAPIQNVLKSLELYAIAEALGVPQAIIEAIPDDGLGVAQGGDAAQIGAPYDIVDRVMIHQIQDRFDIQGPVTQLLHLHTVPGVEDLIVMKILRRCLGNKFKREEIVRAPSRTEMGLQRIKHLKL